MREYALTSLSLDGRGIRRLSSLLLSRSWERVSDAPRRLRLYPSQDLLGNKLPSQVYLSRKGREGAML
ncbi:MAG: hypothetical protein RLY97_1881 [Pseudomonadota bacterium]